MNLDELINEIKNTKWERKSPATIKNMRETIALLKITTPGIVLTPMLKEILREQLIGPKGHKFPKGHARDKLAVRLFNHYLDKRGADFALTMADYFLMNSGAISVPGPIDIRKKSWQAPGPAPEWINQLTRAKTTIKSQYYSGSLLWGWDDGAIANYTVRYKGVILKTKTGAFEWKGRVVFYDRFDLDPRWNWSPAHQGGRSALGERRTRIGYMLNLGTDFKIIGPTAEATQLATASHLVFSGKIDAPAAIKTANDIF